MARFLTKARQICQNDSLAKLYSIRAVEAKTGLTQHTIRAWERRYGVVSPQRTDTNRRVYDETDVEKLSLLRAVLAAGHSISNVAHLSAEELSGLLERGVVPAASSAGTDEVSWALLDQGKAHVMALDSAGLLSVLDRGLALLGVSGVVAGIIHPLAEWIGDSWHAGRLRIGHEHMASAVIRTFLDRARSGLLPLPNAPAIVVATPLGQVHEMGAQIVAVCLAVAGHKVVYLGADLPAEDIAHAANSIRAEAVCLSLVYAEGGSAVFGEIERLGSLLEPGTSLVLGGRAAPAFEHIRRKIGALVIDDLDELSDYLNKN